jgi:NADPH-dependent 2,4-dienoyl-CoA reductase/sulfur reductase-like enzyme
MRYALIGGGCAALEAARAIRGLDQSGEIAVFNAGTLPPYNPMLTSYYAGGRIDYRVLFPAGQTPWEELGVKVLAGSPVTALSVQARTLTNAAGETFAFDKCLIASGASSFVPDFPGHDNREIFVMRTAEDAVALKKRLAERPVKKALVVGASMVGIKLVELFLVAGAKVCLADMASCIFPLSACPECAAVVEERLRGLGVRLRFKAGIERVEDADTGGVKAWFGDGKEPEEADLILACIGVRPNTAFVKADEVALSRGAILVNERLETSAADVYAAGDCAAGRNLASGAQQVIGLLANARRQGRAAGVNMAGGSAIVDGEILHNITHFCGMDFAGIGNAQTYDEVRQERRENAGEGCRYQQSYSWYFYKNGVLVGANFIDNLEDLGLVKNELVKQLRRASPK